VLSRPKRSAIESGIENRRPNARCDGGFLEGVPAGFAGDSDAQTLGAMFRRDSRTTMAI